MEVLLFLGLKLLCAKKKGPVLERSLFELLIIFCL